MSANITVSIAMVTYNHERFIAEAIESVLGQKTDFNFQLVIGEDFSTDSTRAICEKYAQQYPGKIKLLNRPQNVGALKNFADVLAACEGKYIALLDGDDYWTSTAKLQTQVDFLEQHPDVVCHSHNTRIVDEKGFVRIYNDATENKFLTSDEVLYNISMHTSSVLFRNCINPLPAYLAEMPYDLILLFALSQHGRFYQSVEMMSDYRIHDTGIWAGVNELKRFNLKIKITEHLISKLPTTMTQKKRLRQVVVNVKLNRLKYYANNNFLSRDYFSDAFFLVRRKMMSFQFSMPFFAVCLTPDAVINMFRKKNSGVGNGPAYSGER